MFVVVGGGGCTGEVRKWQALVAWLVCMTNGQTGVVVVGPVGPVRDLAGPLD